MGTKAGKLDDGSGMGNWGSGQWSLVSQRGGDGRADQWVSIGGWVSGMAVGRVGSVTVSSGMSVSSGVSVGGIGGLNDRGGWVVDSWGGVMHGRVGESWGSITDGWGGNVSSWVGGGSGVMWGVSVSVVGQPGVVHTDRRMGRIHGLGVLR